MIKYVVIETISLRENNPYWYPGVGQHESEYIEVTRTSATTFTSEKDLSEYLASQYRSNKRVEVYEVARQLIPTLETKTVVSFKCSN